jgi:SSS family solute:Na+ symporter
VIFLLGLFWPRATEAGALTGAVASVLLSLVFRFGGIAALEAVPFMNRMAIIFVISLLLAMGFRSRPQVQQGAGIRKEATLFRTSPGFNAAALAILAILVALYAYWW